MTSQIVSATIDENFPVAGQDNDSQGFRDNFSIIKDGLATANAELTELQTNAAKLNVANNFNGTLIDNAQTNRLYGTVFPFSGTTGTTTVAYENGEYQIIPVTGNHSIKFTGFPTSSNELYAKIRLELYPSTEQVGGWTVTFISGGGAQVIGTVGFPTPGQNPTLSVGDNPNLKTIVDVWTSNGEILFLGLVGAFDATLGLESLTDVDLTTLADGEVLVYNSESEKWVNGTISSITSLGDVGDVSYTSLSNGDILKWSGTTWVPSSDDIGSFYTGTERVVDASSVNLTKTAGYFITGAIDEGAVLGAGTEGQIKVLVMDTTEGGDMVINTTNPGWGGAGTITFTTVGQGCTLQYINSKWFCVGNNGATFA